MWLLRDIFPSKTINIRHIFNAKRTLFQRFYARQPQVFYADCIKNVWILGALFPTLTKNSSQKSGKSGQWIKKRKKEKKKNRKRKIGGCALRFFSYLRLLGKFCRSTCKALSWVVFVFLFCLAYQPSSKFSPGFWLLFHKMGILPWLSLFLNVIIWISIKHLRLIHVKTWKKGSLRVKNIANIIVLLDKTGAKRLHSGWAASNSDGGAHARKL